MLDVGKGTDRTVYTLWKIIDDIDSISDIVKDDNQAYRELVEKTIKKRWGVLSEKEVDALYDKFYKLSEG